MAELSMWKVDDGELHWVVATDDDDAMLVIVESGATSDTEVDEYRLQCGLIVERVDDSYVVGVRDDDEGTKTSKPASQWVESEGRGYLAGSCW